MDASLPGVENRHCTGKNSKVRRRCGTEEGTLIRLLRTSAILFAMTLAGCAATSMRHDMGSPGPYASVSPAGVPTPQVNLSGYPPAFRDGYTDGCASSGGTLRRDEQRYQSDPQYKYGWHDGKDVCSRRH
jgi:hypothetical protein